MRLKKTLQKKANLLNKTIKKAINTPKLMLKNVIYPL